MKTHKDLLVWQKSIQFVTHIYDQTKSFPREEIYCLVSQIRRACISIPSNISEGCARKNTTEYIHFLYIALGSAAELETQLIISTSLNYISDDTANDLMNQLTEIIRMLTGLIKSLSKDKLNT